jgi:hypothetical protein
MMSLTYKLFMLSVIMQNVDMLSVVTPFLPLPNILYLVDRISSNLLVRLQQVVFKTG